MTIAGKGAHMTRTPRDAGLEPARTHHLESLVGVAEGAVVSRVLMKNAGGSVTLFAFDEGQFLSEHTAPFDAMVQLLDGALKVTIDGSPHQLGGGDAILMPADVPHALQADAPSRMLLVMLREPRGEA